MALESAVQAPQAAGVFGVVIKNSDGKDVPARAIGEQHVKEDLGWIPTVGDWLRMVKPERWMGANVQTSTSRT